MWLRKRKGFLRRQFRNGDDLVRTYLDKSPCGEAVFHDGRVLEHPADRSGFAGMILELWYEQVYTGDFYQPKPGDTVIDAGANIGLFSLQIARQEPGARVFAFEPFAENFALLERNLSTFKATSVTAFAAALSGVAGVAEMVAVGSRSQCHQLAMADVDARGLVDPERGDGESADSVNVYSLDQLMDMVETDRIAMFKCDIEGSEAELFEHARLDHLERVDRFGLEWHEHARPGVLELLKRKLEPTHEVRVATDDEAGRFGMLYATRRA